MNNFLKVLIVVLVFLGIFLVIKGKDLNERVKEEDLEITIPSLDTELPENVPPASGDTPIAVSQYKDLIKVTYPMPGDEITSPLVIKGEARGMWFFEGDFPVVLTNWDGLIIAEGYASAEGDWMTEEYVPFTGTLNFEKPDFGEKGTLILQKDNPSDLPELDDAFEFDIIFK